MAAAVHLPEAEVHQWVAWDTAGTGQEAARIRVEAARIRVVAEAVAGDRGVGRSWPYDRDTDRPAMARAEGR